MEIYEIKNGNVTFKENATTNEPNWFVHNWFEATPFLLVNENFCI